MLLACIVSCTQEVCLIDFFSLSRNRETQNLQKQIEMMKAAVAREEEKAYELEIKSKSVH